MSERPIIFNSEMVRAVMEGRKVQTRRIMKVQPHAGVRSSVFVKSGFEDGHGKELVFPYGAVGDRLWVRETWQCTSFETNEYGHVEGVDYMRQISVIKPNSPAWCVSYKADGFESDDANDRGFPWRPSIHMPRWASRITLEITGVRVERLWEISEDDAKAEGCTFEALRFKPGTREVEKMGHTAIFQFGTLWESIYGEEGWQANPWVWVIEFKRVEGE